MKLGALGHLTYSTLVHPGDNWEQMWDSLVRYVPQVKARVCPSQPFGVSLRLSAESARTLRASPQERARLAGFLRDNDLYLYTVNAFVYGPFKNQRVKEQVYEPDWRTAERLTYTQQVAEVLAEVSPPWVEPSIQSPPLGFKPRVTGPDVVEAYAANLRAMAAFLHRLRERTGRTVTLAIEPEPYCYLETTDEVIAFFTGVLRSPSSVAALARELGVDAEAALAILVRHVGVVYDICHQAVEFENIGASLQSLADHGISVFKLQEAAAMRIPRVDADAVAELRNYADSIYLTQTVESRGGRQTRFLNLEDAFAAFAADPGAEREWRTHFHVPVFLEKLGPRLETTRFAIEEALAFHQRNPRSAQLEIETYTWDVLPAKLKTGNIVDYVATELEWVRSQLRA